MPRKKAIVPTQDWIDPVAKAVRGLKAAASEAADYTSGRPSARLQREMEADPYFQGRKAKPRVKVGTAAAKALGIVQP